MVFLRTLLMPALLASAGLLPQAKMYLPNALETLLSDAREFAKVDEIRSMTPTVALKTVHTADDGQSSLADSAAETKEEELRYTRASDGLFYVHARVNGKRIRFVLDTGSSFVVLTGRDAATLGLKPANDKYRSSIQTAGGNTPMAWTTLDSVSVGKRRLGRLRAAIVPAGLHVSLMGQNMVSRLGRVTIAGESLRLE